MAMVKMKQMSNVKLFDIHQGQDQSHKVTWNLNESQGNSQGQV